MEGIKIYADELVNWLKTTVESAGAKGIVFGLSGGVDSAVVAAAAKKAFPDTSLGIIMPCHSNSEDEADALLVARELSLKTKKVVLDDVFDSLVKASDIEGSKLAIANIKPRIRMTTLYYHAQSLNYLVAGTSNRSEWTVGYFTKHGDSGADILPLVSFVKQDIWKMAKYFNVPEKIVNKIPSAGLWDDQTDEQEMGITYKELDKYILTKEADTRVKSIVDRMYNASQHKREFPKIFTPGKTK